MVGLKFFYYLLLFIIIIIIIIIKITIYINYCCSLVKRRILFGLKSNR